MRFSRVICFDGFADLKENVYNILVKRHRQVI